MVKKITGTKLTSKGIPADPNDARLIQPLCIFTPEKIKKYLIK